MPSLRRTFSSPTVRSSPYPAYSPSSALYNATRTQNTHRHRRSSGSDANHRRVLADIDWWRVADGQRLDPGNGEDQAEGVRHHDRRGPIPPERPGSVVALSLEQENATLSWSSTDLPFMTNSFEEPPSPPTDQFAELSIVPRTPTQAHDDDDNDDDSAPSSLLATPEPIFLSLEGTTLGCDVSRAPSSKQKRNRSVTMPAFPTKKKLFDDLLFNDFGDFSVAPYADFTISPLSSHSRLLLN
ncbi:hypothetical protein AX15_001089 [Amanita polypyramis BW_CC]|nr:hypothetical protein AX15_001089 [Amanita polypyramis BW_CC]